jgi:serine/threonine protein kinase
MPLIIAGVYRVTHLISNKGAYGKVLGATHKETQAEVAIKVGEDTAGTLRNEIDVYRHLLLEEKDLKTGPADGPNAKWPTLISSGQEGKFTYLVMQKFGPSLADVANRFVGDLAAVLRVGLQMLALIEHLHNAGVVHGDIKPDNFVYGTEKSSSIYILDFGLAQIINNPPPYAHIVGSPRFASVRVLGGIHHLPTRPDDLESFSYTLIYLFKGRLPWQQEPLLEVLADEQQLATEHHDVTLKEKYVYDATVPGEFLLLVHYCRNLKADKLPNYAYLKLILLNLYKTLQ